MKKTVLLLCMLALSVLSISAQGGKGKFLIIYDVNGQEEHMSSAGISFVHDNQSSQYAWRPIDSPWTTFETLGEAFNIKNVNSIIRYFDSDNQISVEIPQNAPITNSDIIVKAYGDEISPSNENSYSTGASYVSVVNSEGKIIYDSYISLDENDDTRAVEINALETAYTLLIPIFPFVFEPTSDQILSTLKALLSELPETHSLAAAIDRSIIKNGYLVMDDIDAEYNIAADAIVEKIGLRDNYLGRRNIRRVKPYDYQEPYVVNGNWVYGLKLAMSESNFDWIGPRWHCTFTAYNSNRFAYTAWLRGYKTENGVLYYNDEDMETMMKRILKPQRVSTFMGTFTSWSGLKDYFSDTYRLFTEDNFGFDDMTWDNTKLSFDMNFYSEKDVVIVAGPADNEFMLYYNILKVVLGPVVKALTKGISTLASNATDGQSELYESDYLVPFITDLLTDVDYKFNFQAIYNSDESLGEKAAAILDLTWPKFQKYMDKFAVEQLNLMTEREAIKYFGFFTTAQLRKAMEDISKNWNKYLKVVEIAGDTSLGLLGLTEGSYYYDIAIDFGPDDPLTLETYQVNVAKGKEVYIPISSGNGNYKLKTSAPNVATAVIKDVGSSSSGGLQYSVLITGIDEGKCVVTVTDTRLQEANIEVEVTAPNSCFSCPDGNHPHMIDLGLPSGTKWACCNVGATTPEGYGDYFAWGETQTRNYYDWSTYIHSDGSQESCHDIGSDIAGTQYDAATANWGTPWQMPSLAQCEELINNCTSIWTTQNGINGRMFMGPNGGTIFLPAAGVSDTGSLYNVGSNGYFWSSSLNSDYSDSAWYLDFGSDYANLYDDYRILGQSVRAVTSSGLPSPSINVTTLSATDISGTSATLNGSVAASNTNKSFEAGFFLSTTSSSPSSTDYTKNVTCSSSSPVGNFSASATGLSAGTKYNYRAYVLYDGKYYYGDTKSFITSSSASYTSCPDNNHPHLIDLGLPSGTKWACCNVGATTPEGYGDYFAWGETQPKDEYKWSTYIHCDGSFDNIYDIGSDIAGTQYDAATANWGTPWQMPTEDQYEELINKCTSVWTTQNGVNGYKLTGANGGTLFLPAAGYWYGASLFHERSFGFYWSSSLEDSSAGFDAWCLYFYSTYAGMNDEARYHGHSVRPVRKN